ncbi:MAG: hypothetical protein KZQ95_09710 [Candidatus Thiodiazotropha sp. (ex Epidulcina cf. delphinae)]|nr:hypothetical protein [Candidatus Thiodiazotropha sp. (ex Epidulcina cf. delphinae)]
MCADESKDNPALRRLYQADQTDRQGFPKAEQQRGLLIERDRRRIQAVHDAIAGGELNTAADFYHAAMILQHSRVLEDIVQAGKLAGRAMALAEKGSSLYCQARWLTAAADDRSRMYQGQPQRYGTQFVHNEETGRWELYRLDQQAVSDADRREHGIDLEQIQKTLEELNAASQ